MIIEVKKTYNILIIEDNVDDYELFQRLLSRAPVELGREYLLTHAESGDQGIASIAFNLPDCVLLDFSLPGRDGLNILQEIRQQYPNLPVVVLTGQGDENLAVKLLKAGAQDYLVKSKARFENLDRTIEQAITRSQALQQAQEQPDGSHLLIIDDNPDDREFIVRSLKRAKTVDYSFTEVESGEKAFAYLSDQSPNFDCVLLDYSMPGFDGIQVLQQIVLDHPFLPVIILTGQGNETIATEAIKSGAFHYLVKSSMSADAVDNAVRSAIEQKKLEYRIAEKDLYIQKHEQEVTEYRELLELVVNSAKVVIWDYDCQLKEIKFNRQLEELLGWHSTEPVKLAVFINRFLRAEEMLRFDEHFNACLQGVQTSFEYTCKMYSDPKNWKWVRCTGNVVSTSQEGAPLRIAGTLNDVTEEKKAVEHIIAANEELERFAYMSSHDLQEPLRMVASFTEILQKEYAENLDTRGKQFIQFAYDASLQMQRMIKSLLEYAKTQQDNIQHEMVDMNQVIDVAKQALSASFEESRATLICAPLPSIKSNHLQMSSMLQNLLGNALKYRKPNLVPTIKVDVSKQGDFWVFSVADNGIGFKPEYGEKIFEPFKRLHRRDEYAGTGMGLAICRKVVQELGGSIWAKSALGEGTTIFFSIPAQIVFEK